jgi:hypothetical protein
VNTQRKIQKLDGLRESLARDAWTVVVGRFDPMTCESADALEALAEPKRKLMVVVQGHVQRREGELLSAEARAVLVAALRSVDVVLVGDSDAWRHALVENTNIRLIEDAGVENSREQSFRDLVLSRQSGAGV